MTIEDLWKLTRRYWLISLTVGTGLAWAYVVTRTPVYTATTTALVAPISQGGSESSTGSAYSGSLLAQTKASAWKPLFTSTGTAEKANETLELSQSPRDLASRITVEVEDESPTITVSATADSPEEAQRVADAIVVATASEAERLEGRSAGVEIKPVENAQLPDSPSLPKPARILPVGAAGGLLVGYLIAFIKLRRDTRSEPRETSRGPPTRACSP